MSIKIIVLSLFLSLSTRMLASSLGQSKTVQQHIGCILDLPPFERAIRCIKYYEGFHHEENYPFVGYGHKLKAGECYPTEMSDKEADKLLRKDLKNLCAFFRKYGKDSLLLATLAYNIGPYKIAGDGQYHPKSKLLQKIESGRRDFKKEYVQYCHWKGQKVPSIERRRFVEFMLLFKP